MDYYPTQFDVDDDGYNYLPKGPSESLTYTLDYTVQVASTEVINSSNWIADGPLTVSGEVVNGKLVSAKIFGGDVGNSYLVENTVVTNSGQTIVRKFKLVIVER